MTWGRVDEALSMHIKTVTAGNAAMGLWVRCLSWSCANGTDGLIPAAVAKTMGSTREINALVTAELWTVEPGGYRFHDWAEYQEPADVIEARAEARKVAAKKAADARWDAVRIAKGIAQSSAESNAGDDASEMPLTPMPFAVVQEVGSPLVVAEEGDDAPSIEKHWNALPPRLRPDAPAAAEKVRKVLRRHAARGIRAHQIPTATGDLPTSIAVAAALLETRLSEVEPPALYIAPKDRPHCPNHPDAELNGQGVCALCRSEQIAAEAEEARGNGGAA